MDRTSVGLRRQWMANQVCLQFRWWITNLQLLMIVGVYPPCRCWIVNFSSLGGFPCSCWRKVDTRIKVYVVYGDDLGSKCVQDRFSRYFTFNYLRIRIRCYWHPRTDVVNPNFVQYLLKSMTIFFSEERHQLSYRYVSSITNPKLDHHAVGNWKKGGSFEA